MRSKSGWWKTGAGSLAVRVTDILATRDCFLEKSGQMVLPLRGEGFFILVIDGELKTQQGSYSRHRSHPIPNRKKVKVLVDQSWLTLCNLMNCSPPGSSVHGILQASGCHSLFQAIVQAQALNPGLPPCRQILYQLSPREAPSRGELNS